MTNYQHTQRYLEGMYCELNWSDSCQNANN